MSHHRDFDQDGERLRVQWKSLGDGRFEVMVGDRIHRVSAVRLPDGRVRCTTGDETFVGAAGPAGRTGMHVRIDDQTFLLPGHTGSTRGVAGVVADGVIEAPMTGTLLEVKVGVGDTVVADQTVAVVTAMKMEHKLSAGIDGTVVEVAVVAGATVTQGELILRVVSAGD